MSLLDRWRARSGGEGRMSTWDDNPNDYKSAVSMIGRLRAALKRFLKISVRLHAENARLRAALEKIASGKYRTNEASIAKHALVEEKNK